MSLMKLLTVSRSFVTGPSPLGRYRMVGQRSGVPQFGATVKPRRSAACPAPTRPVPSSQRELPKLASDPDCTVPPAAKAVVAPQSRPAKSPFTKSGAAVAAAHGGPVERMGSARKLISSLRGWLRPKQGRRIRSPFAGKAARPPVQAHLKLESVRVVRNDLSDSDFEVRARQTTQAARTLEGRGLAKLRHGLGAMSWTQMASRWFETGRARVQTR